MKEKLKFIHVILGASVPKMARVSGVKFGTMQRILHTEEYFPKQSRIIDKIENYLTKFDFDETTPN